MTDPRKKRRLTLCVLGYALALCGCTDNMRVRALGGRIVKDLSPGQKVVTVTWKESNLWVLARPMRPDEKPETYTFYEWSNFGVMQGEVVLREAPR